MNIFSHLAPTEAAAERIYLAAYRAEYDRVYDPPSCAGRGEPARAERLAYWSALAGTAGRRARDRYLMADTTSPTPEAQAPCRRARRGRQALQHLERDHHWRN